MWRDFTNAARELWRTFANVSDSYRPELHYMRGPGPKWHAKRAETASPSSLELHDIAEIRAQAR